MEIENPVNKTVNKWIDELKQADKVEAQWRKEAEYVIETYRGDDCRSEPTDNSGNPYKKNVFNILWSNTETIKPALYNSQPAPVVKRRFRDEDKVGHAASEVLQRALSFSIDAYAFDEDINLDLLDYLLTGRGVSRVRYVPTIYKREVEIDIETGEVETEEEYLSESESEPESGEVEAEIEYEEEVAYEEAICEHVHWDDFRHGPGRTWSEVTWVAYRHKMSRKELIDQFGEEIGKEVPLNLSPNYNSDNPSKRDDESGTASRAEVWEIWDKEEREVIFICVDYKDEPLLVEDDPLNLQDFFPSPRPIYSIQSSNSLVPIPEYSQYQALAEELTKATRRIIKLLDAMRARGVYDSSLGSIAQLMTAAENDMIPVTDLARFVSEKGFDGAIWFMPIQNFYPVLQALQQYRTELIQSIYEITGISDILRGQGAAMETATAQRIKSNWGALRLQDRQREVQRYIRDIIRLLAEIIGENFSNETLALMTGLDYMTNDEKQAMQMQAEMIVASAQTNPEAQQMVEQYQEEYQEAMSKPTWEEIRAVIGNDMMREFKIDIETDSTIAEQMSGEKQEISELMGSLVEFMTAAAPFVQSNVLPMDSARTMLMAMVRRYKLGTEVEDAISKIGTGEPPEQNDAASQLQQIEKMKVQGELQREQMRMQKDQMDHEQAVQKMNLEMERDRREHEYKMRELGRKYTGEVAVQNAQTQGDVTKAVVGG